MDAEIQHGSGKLCGIAGIGSVQRYQAAERCFETMQQLDSFYQLAEKAVLI